MVILRIFRHDPLKSEDLFRFSERIRDAKCEALTETLEIGEIEDFHYEVIPKPGGNSLKQLIEWGQLEVDELWRVAGMVNRHSFRLQLLGLPYPPPADCIYLAADGSVSAIIGPSDLAGRASNPAREIQSGDVVANKYLLKEAIGEGGSALVFEAEQLHPISRKIALKLSKSACIDSETNHQFDIERSSLMMLDHPNIARILDAGFACVGKPFLAMELIPGGIPLTDYCANYKVSLKRQLKLFAAVCETVSYAHGEGIVHRDLKPSNILVVPPGSQSKALPAFKILDFGISGTITESAGEQAWSQKIARGTPEYMAPEQESGRGNAPVDVFALGRILSELLGAANAKDAAKVRSSQLELIAIKAQSPTPQDRYLSPSQLATAINEHLRGVLAGSRSPERASAVGKLFRRIRLASNAFMKER